MKNTSLYILCLFLCSFQELVPILKFESQKHNFGFVHQGEILEFDYPFVNTGKAPLLITGTKTECSCTTATYPPIPVLPGGTGKIHLRFDTKSAIDRQERTVIVSSNAPAPPQTLVFKCIVLKKKK